MLLDVGDLLRLPVSHVRQLGDGRRLPVLLPGQLLDLRLQVVGPLLVLVALAGQGVSLVSHRLQLAGELFDLPVVLAAEPLLHLHRDLHEGADVLDGLSVQHLAPP